MAIDFPASPTIGQQSNGFVYDGTKWKASPTSVAPSVVSATPPTNPTVGDMWFNSTDGTMYFYYNDGNTSQWVESRAPITANGYYSPNYIINGAFDISQRGTSITGIQSDNTYTADRWYVARGGALNYSQGTSNPPAGFNNFGSFVNNGASNPFIAMYQTIETKDAINLAGKVVTLSFWARANANTTASKNFLARGLYSTTVDAKVNVVISSLSFSAPYGTTSSDWTRYSHTFTVPATAKTVGIAFQSTATLAVGDGLHITGVQLEEGSAATTFRRNANSIAGELAACQRYYWRYTQDQSFQLMGLGSSWSGGEVVFALKLPVTMRATPSASISDIGGVYWLANNTNYSGASSFSQRTTKETYGFAATLTSPINVPLVFRPPLNSYMEASAEL